MKIAPYRTGKNQTSQNFHVKSTRKQFSPKKSDNDKKKIQKDFKD